MCACESYSMGYIIFKSPLVRKNVCSTLPSHCAIIFHMDNLFRLSSRINFIFGIVIALLAVFAYFIENAFGNDDIGISVVFSLVLAVFIGATGIIGERSLEANIEGESRFDVFRMRKIGAIICGIIFVIAVIGTALGAATGTISYLYILMIPAMALYCYCVWTLRPPKKEPTLVEQTFGDHRVDDVSKKENAIDLTGEGSATDAVDDEPLQDE